MKIKKNGKVIRLTESDLKRIVKKVLSEQEIIMMDTPQPQDNTRVDQSYLPTPPDFSVEKKPDCSELLYDETMEIFRKGKQGKKELRVGPIAQDFEDIRLQVVTGPVQPGYEGVYVYKKGESDAYCKFDFKRFNK